MAEPSFVINGHTLDTSSQSEGGKYFTPDASNSNYILLQCRDFLSNEQCKELADLNVQVLQYHRLNTYLCRYEPTDLNILRSLPYVLSASVFHQDVVATGRLRAEFEELKEASRLLEENPPMTSTSPVSASEVDGSRVKTGEVPKIPVVILLHRLGDRTPEAVKQHLIELLQRDPEDITVADDIIEVKLEGHELDAVARIDEVRTIERNPTQVLHSNAARKDMGITRMMENGSGDTATNKLWGNGEIICVADSGFDIGLQSPTLTPPRQMFTNEGQNRVSIEPTFLPATLRTGTLAEQTEDAVGHGTHVSGCVAAWGRYSDTHVTKWVRGTAPDANILFQVRLQQDGSVASITPQVLDQAYAKGARVHNNSYGPDVNRNTPFIPYNPFAEVVDTYTTRSITDRSDMVIVWAAGNSGVEAGKANQSISSTALAKNSITVGSCESSNPTKIQKLRKLYIDYVYDRLSGPGSIDNIAAFSSRGPDSSIANMVRMKPDLVAPGTCILSARSQSSVFAALMAPDGVTPASDFDGVSDDNEWMYAGGTSMSAPLVSGCAAVLRAVIKSKRICVEPSPRATLIKALLVNGATDLNGAANRVSGRGGTPGPYPDCYQGFGRVNMEASMLNVTNTKNGGFVEIVPGLLQGEVWRKQIFPERGRTYDLRATMVFADRPGADLQSVLQLRVFSITSVPPPIGAPTPPPVTRYANTNHVTIADSVNNVQKLVWNGVTRKLIWLEVTAVQITPEPLMPPYRQPFSVVWYLDYR